MTALDGGAIDLAETHARAAGAIFARLADPWGEVETRLLHAQIARIPLNEFLQRRTGLAFLRQQASGFSFVFRERHAHRARVIRRPGNTQFPAEVFCLLVLKDRFDEGEFFVGRDFEDKIWHSAFSPVIVWRP
jgi:hypothetical protein